MLVLLVEGLVKETVAGFLEIASKKLQQSL